jgi:hydrogenase-4 component B
MIDAKALTIVFFLLCCAGVLLPLVLPANQSTRVIAWVGSAASLALCAIGVEGLVAYTTFEVRLWTIPNLGSLTVSLDRLSGLFLLVTGLVVLATAIYSGRYLERYSGDFSLRAFAVAFHSLVASVGIILVAGDVLLFLLGWEAMSILAYLLVNCQKRAQQDRDAGYQMLTMSEAGFVAVVIAFLLLGKVSGGLSFEALRAAAVQAGPGLRWAVFLLSFSGFGVKAGLVPFNRWLPGVYAVAPANVCALLSGVLLNLGIYGIIRVNGDLLPLSSISPGLLMLIIGAISALVGILYANRESDMKRMLAESSIENMGIVVAGLGAGLVFSASHALALAGIAFVAALYQMVNHAVYKALLFHGAGAVDSVAGTSDMDRLGGLAKSVPWISAFFLIGALAIAGLPPLNGFVSEWLTLQSLLQSAALSSVGVKVVFALCGAALALTAGLAVTCFVKVYAMSFLGMPRSENVRPSDRRSHHSMRFAMGLLAMLCLLLGILPTYVIPILGGPVRQLTGTGSTSALVPAFFALERETPPIPAAFVGEFHDLGAQIGRSVLPGLGLVVLHRGAARNPVVFAMSTSYMFVVLVLVTGTTVLVIRYGLARRRQRLRKLVWAGGLAHLLPEQTYTATGFSNPVRVTFSAIFHPGEIEDTSEMVAEHFRLAIRRAAEEVHILDRLLYRPLRSGATKLAAGLARMHHGRLNAYVAYVLLCLFLVLVLGRLL